MKKIKALSRRTGTVLVGWVTDQDASAIVAQPRYAKSIVVYATDSNDNAHTYIYAAKDWDITFPVDIPTKRDVVARINGDTYWLGDPWTDGGMAWVDRNGDWYDTAELTAMANTFGVTVLFGGTDD